MDTKATGSVNKYNCFASNKPSHCLICSKYLLSAVLLKSIFNNKANIHLSSLGDDEWTQGLGRTVGQKWCGGTEESPWHSLQSLPLLRGWGGLWYSSGMVVLRVNPGTPFSPSQDSRDGKDCGIAVVWWD